MNDGMTNASPAVRRRQGSQFLPCFHQHFKQRRIFLRAIKQGLKCSIVFGRASSNINLPRLSAFGIGLGRKVGQRFNMVINTWQEISCGLVYIMYENLQISFESRLNAHVTGGRLARTTVKRSDF